MVKVLMRPRGGGISAVLPGARACGCHQTTRRSGPPVPERGSHCLSPGGFARCGSAPRTPPGSGARSPNKIIFDSTSAFTDRIHRSQWALRLGLRAGNRTASIPTLLRIASKAAQNFASRSCARYRHPPRNPRSAKVAFRAICSIHREAGEVVIPAIHSFRDAMRMKTSTWYVINPPAVHTSAVKKSTAARTSVCARTNSRHAIPFPRSGAGANPCRFRTLATVWWLTSGPARRRTDRLMQDRRSGFRHVVEQRRGQQPSIPK